LKLLSSVSAILVGAAIPHSLIGAAAMTVYGVGRSTLDLDLLTTEPRALDGAMWRPIREAGASVDLRRGDADDPLAGIVRFEMPGEAPVDLVVGRGAWQKEILSRSPRVRLGGLELAVALPSDLILLKLYAGGPQDAWDIQQLLAAGDRAALVAEVERRLGQLPPEAAALWARAK
jgi:hypothetical protein